MSFKIVRSPSTGGGPSTDEKAKVSSNDTTSGYLNGKLVAGSGISLIENNDGGNETLTVKTSLESISVTTNTTITTQRIINVDTTGGNVILTLPDISTLSDGYTIYIKDEGGASWYNTIQANGFGSDLIDGQASVTIENSLGALLLILGDGQWRNASIPRLYYVNDSSGIESINFYGRILKDSAASLSLDWYSRTLNDSAGVGSVDWENKTLHDDYSGAISVFYGDHKLKDTSGYNRFDWQLGEMRDGADIKSIDISYRNLFDSAGTLLLDYSSGLKLSALTTDGIVGTTGGNGTLYINDKIIADGTAAVIGQTLTGLRSNAIVVGLSNTQTLGIAGANSGVIVGTSNSDARGAAIIVGNSNTVNSTGGTENYTTVAVGYGNTISNQRSGAFGVSNNVGNNNNAWSFGYGNSHAGANSVALGQNLTSVAANQIWIGLGATTRAIIDSSGRMILGNGISSATYNLEIYAVTNANATLRIKAPTSGNAAGIILDGGSTSNPYLVFYRGGSPTFQIRSNNSSSFSIYSYLSAPNAESLVINGSTHAATFTGVCLGPNGTASAPTYSASGDTNTGMFFPAADSIGYTTGGTERARLNSSGNLGVGTTSTISARIHAISTTEQLRLGYDASNYVSTTVSSAGIVTFDAVGASSSFRFSDKVGIGTNPSYLFHVYDNVTGVSGIQGFFENVDESGRAQFILSSGTYSNNFFALMTHGTSVTSAYYPTYLGAGNDAGKGILLLQGANTTEFLIGAYNSIPVSFFTGNTIAFTLTTSQEINISDSFNLKFSTTNGTKIGTATNEKISFWNATPVAQPTTAITGATRTAVGGFNIAENDTFDGYTINQVVAALRQIGVLA